jgi:DNA-binding XRE family transcriptional regulator
MPARITRKLQDRFTTAPTPAQIRAERLRCGRTQVAAARLVRVSPRTWQQWEQGRAEMPRGLFELFVLKQGDISGIRPPSEGSRNGNSHLRS